MPVSIGTNSSSARNSENLKLILSCASLAAAYDSMSHSLNIARQLMNLECNWSCNSLLLLVNKSVSHGDRDNSRMTSLSSVSSKSVSLQFVVFDSLKH